MRIREKHRKANPPRVETQQRPAVAPISLDEYREGARAARR
jgi:hypothetical protein